MRTSLTLLLFFMLIGNVSQAKKVDFYVPPIMKFKLDPDAWVMPYTTPYAYCAKTFDSNGTVVIKHLESNLNFTFSCQYDEDLMAYFEGKSLLSKAPAIENFDIYKPTYGNADRVFLINNTVPSMTLFIEINVNVSSNAWREVAEALLEKLIYVDPGEIDRLVGYPFQDSHYDQEIVLQRLAWKKKNTPTSNERGYTYGYDQKELSSNEEKKLMMDYTVGFSYTAFHEARVKLINKKVTQEEKVAYAFGFCPSIPGLMMMDSISTSFSQYKMGKTFMTDLITSNFSADDFKFKYAFRISSANKGFWWLLTSETQFSICFAYLDDQQKLRFHHHIGESESWIGNGKLWKREPLTSYDPFSTTYKLPPYELLGGNGQIFKWQLQSTMPTPNGIVFKGVATYFVDLTRPEADMLVMEPAVDLSAYDLVYIDAGKKRKINSYSNEYNVIYDKSENLYNWFFRDTKTNQLIPYGYVNIDFKSEDNRRSHYIKALEATPQKTLIVSSLLQTDKDKDQFSLSRVYVSNGKIVRCESIEWSPVGMEKKVYDTEIPAQIADHVWTKDILYKSQNNYTNPHLQSLTWKESYSSRYDGGRTQRVCEVKSYDPILIIPTDGDMPVFTISKSEMHRLMSSVKYPPDAKRKNIGGVVTVKTTVDANGRILSAKANNTIPGAPDLSIEAERLVKSLQTLDKGFKTPSGQTTVLISIRFAP